MATGADLIKDFDLNIINGTSNIFEDHFVTDKEAIDTPV